jgi:hypothetical protein
LEKIINQLSNSSQFLGFQLMLKNLEYKKAKLRIQATALAVFWKLTPWMLNKKFKKNRWRLFGNGQQPLKLLKRRMKSILIKS